MASAELIYLVHYDSEVPPNLQRHIDRLVDDFSSGAINLDEWQLQADDLATESSFSH